MLDFSRVKSRELTLAKLVEGLTKDDLVDLTNEMIDRQLALIAGCDDAAVVFVPSDPDAKDPYAANPDDVGLAWTLGHIVVHVTASAEEAAFIAAEMARGVSRPGRSRYETPWQTVTTLEACRARLEESRRMRLASLAMWPDAPHLDVTETTTWLRDPIDAVGRFARGLYHDADHLDQIAEIVRQAVRRVLPLDA